jgi:N-acetylneuraminic acid mutarotase
MNKPPVSIRTYLFRGAFLLSLLCVIVIPFALGQRQNNKAPLAPDVCPTPWQLDANMPLDVYGSAGASDGTYSYHAGGYSFTTGTTVTSLYRYDPVANTWSTLAPMTTAGAIMASAVYYPTTNKIYVFGGEDAATGVNSNATRIYDIATNTWSAGAPMPDVRSFMASGYNSANGKIYLVSGYNTGTVDSAQPDTWEYDPVANTFTSKAMFPHPAGGMASGFINGVLYVAGGRDASNTVINLNWAYDPVANTWTAKANMPGSNNNVAGSGVALDRLWAFGGGNPFGPAARGSTKAAFARPLDLARIKDKTLIPVTTTSTYLYDPATDSWSSSSNMNVLRSFPSGAAIGSVLIAAGGYNGATTVASAETLDTCIPSPTPTPCPNQYTIADGTDTIVPGTDDTGNHIDDGDTLVSLPFSFMLYGQPYNAVNVNSNGRLDFVVVNEPGGYVTSCLPAPPNIGPYDYTIFGLWHDLRTDVGLSGCSTWANGCGIFTSVSGTAPNRIFNIEWHAVEFANNASTANFEVRLYENSAATNEQFDIIYGASPLITGTDTGGVQGDSENGFYTQDFCNAVPPQNVSRTYTIEGCGTPTPTPTPTPTATPTVTPTPTPGQIVLTGQKRRTNGGLMVRLNWTGATRAQVDIYRNGAQLARVPNNGSYIDTLTTLGTYTYKVCDKGTMNCSNELTVRFGGGAQ